MKQFFTLFFALIILAGTDSCKKKDGSSNKQQAVQAAVDKVRKALTDSLGIQVPSLSVLIQTPTDKIFVSSADDPGQLVTPNTYYRFASNTKSFTATSIMNMYEDGWLDFKARITDPIPGSTTPYVPATANWDFPNKNIITIEQLLQHSAGVFDVDNDPVPGYGGLSYTDYTQQADPAHQFATEEMVKVLKDKNLVYFAPGASYHYSNTGFSILSEIIRRVYTLKAGKEKTYADYLTDYIVGEKAPVPLGSIHFPVLASDINLPDPRAIGTEVYTDKIIKNDKFNMTGQIGEGNGYGTMDDLHRYIRTVMKGQNVLAGATVQLMQKDVSIGNPQYGLGCSYVPNLGYGHTGARLGYLNAMFYDPVHDVSVVSMIPLWDLRKGLASFLKCYNAMFDAAYAARNTLGFPGKP